MNPLTLAQVADWSGGSLEGGSPSAEVTRVSTDSREELGGALFVPIVGERHDAHSFLEQAFAHGAVAALCSRADISSTGPLIRVDDTLAALQRLATRYRASLRDFLAIGVTGSNGKTSTKDFLAEVLAQRYCVLATRGNLNNHIGLPLTVLSVEDRHTAGVFELGMNHFGEIAPLASIARPSVGVITNIGTAHIEFLGSRAGIAQEKGRLVEAIPADGFVVLNANDDMTPALAARSAAPVISAGIEAGDARAENVAGSAFDLVLPGQETVRVELPVPGRHMISNAMLASAVGWRLGLPARAIRNALQSSRLCGGRLQRRHCAKLRFLDDSYNANPDSMLAALRTLVEEPASGRRIAVLGRMGELGVHSAEGHRSVGAAAARSSLDLLLTVGDDDARLIRDAFGDAARSLHFSSHVQAAEWLRAHATSEDVILLKGSRSAAMERVLTALKPSMESAEAVQGGLASASATPPSTPSVTR